MNRFFRHIVAFRYAGAAAFVALLLCLPSANQVFAAQGLPILVYHQLTVGINEPPAGEIAISLAGYEAQMRYLHEQGYRALDMDEVIAYLEGKPFPPKVVAIHLDDGWKTALRALPVLDRYGFKATYWIIAGTGIGEPHLDWTEIEDIARHPRLEVESHTMTHPWREGTTLVDWVTGRTAGKSVDDARWEIVESRRVLERRLAKPIRYLAWPSGYYNDRLIELATGAGYRALLTIDDGLNAPGQDLLRIKRTMIDGRCTAAAFIQLLKDGISCAVGKIGK